MSEAQCRIKELEVEVKKYKRQAMIKGENRPPVTGIEGLKQMGLMPMHLPDDQMIPPRQNKKPMDNEKRKL